MRALKPLSAVYGAVVRAKNALYDGHLLRGKALASPVVSVGNITAGGSGKTPFVIALAALLGEHGVACDVLSRGYGRRSKEVLLVNPDGAAEEFGDEPLLIARAGVPVYVGARRAAAGRLAEREGSGRVHLLDDGFQHRRLARDLDIVLVSSRDLRDALLPAGRLREPVAALRRAHLLASDEDLELPAELRGKPVLRFRRELAIPRIEEAVVAFCGIARPERFFDDLRRDGVALSQTFAFRDHHRFSAADVKRLLALRERCGATLLTTEKDWLRLSPEQREKLSPLLPVPLRTVFDDPQEVWRQVAARLR